MGKVCYIPKYRFLYFRLAKAAARAARMFPFNYSAAVPLPGQQPQQEQVTGREPPVIAWWFDGLVSRPGRSSTIGIVGWLTGGAAGRVRRGGPDCLERHQQQEPAPVPRQRADDEHQPPHPHQRPGLALLQGRALRHQNFPRGGRPDLLQGDNRAGQIWPGDWLTIQVDHLEPWATGSRKTAGRSQTGECSLGEV